MESTNGSLNDIKTLLECIKGMRISQLGFLDDILPLITKKILPFRSKRDWMSGSLPTGVKVEIKGEVSSLFHKNRTKRKMAQWKYDALKQGLVDQRNYVFKSSVINHMGKGLEAYVDFAAWNQSYPFSAYDKTLTDGLSPKAYSAIEVLRHVMGVPDHCWPEEENTYLGKMWTLFSNYEEHTSKNALFQLIIYSILCAIFPDPACINTYKLPKLFEKIETQDKQNNRKVELFMGHQAVACMQQIFLEEEIVFVLGGHGCGKESIVRTLAKVLEENYNFLFYQFDYEGEVQSGNVIRSENLLEAKDTILNNIESSEKPVVLVISDWNGRRDLMYRKVVLGIPAKKSC